MLATLQTTSNASGAENNEVKQEQDFRSMTADFEFESSLRHIVDEKEKVCSELLGSRLRHMWSSSQKFLRSLQGFSRSLGPLSLLFAHCISSWPASETSAPTISHTISQELRHALILESAPADESKFKLEEAKIFARGVPYLPSLTHSLHLWM